MKIHLDHIYVYLTATAPCRSVSLRLVVDNAEMVTEVLVVSGKELVFPDIYEFAVDELSFGSGRMPVEIDFYDMDFEARALGHGADNMCNLAQAFAQHFNFVIQLYNGAAHIGTVSIRGKLTDLETCFPILKLQQDEIAQLKLIYEQLAHASRALENEAGENLIMAQGQIEKLTKKHNDLVVKYNDLLNMFEAKDSENEEMRILLDETEEKLSSVTGELQQQQEVVGHVQKDLDDIALKYERERSLCLDQQHQLEDQSALISKLEEELSRAKSVAHNDNIIVSTDFLENSETTVINNTIVENIVNNIVNNYFITNVVESDDIEKLRQALIEQLKNYEALRARHAKLMKRLNQVVGNVQVCARTRPPSPKEMQSLLLIDTANFDCTDLTIYDAKTQNWTLFDFDRHWAYDGDQNLVFEDVEPLVSAVIPTIDEMSYWSVTPPNVRYSSVFAYGGLGSGKTFTMRGFGDHMGIMYRSVGKVFESLNLQKSCLLIKKSDPKSSHPDSVKSMEYDYKVFLSILEVFDDKVFDLTVDDCNRRNLISSIRFQEGRVNVEGAQRNQVEDVVQGVELLAKAFNLMNNREGFAAREASTAIWVEISSVVKYDAKEAPVESRVLLVELPSVGVRDQNLSCFDRVIESLEARHEVIPYSISPLTSLLQACFVGDARALIIYTFAPTDLTLDMTRLTLDQSVRARNICRQPQFPATPNKHVELKLKAVTTELNSIVLKKSELEETLTVVRSNAADVIRTFNERNEIILKHYLEEKELSKQLFVDLEITNQNLKKCLKDLRDLKASKVIDHDQQSKIDLARE